eukprot:6955830-Prymnesium_polylepis.1
MSANVCLPHGSRAARRWCSDLDMLSYATARSAAAAAAASASRLRTVASSIAAARSAAPASSAAPADAASHAACSCSAASAASNGARRAGTWIWHESGHARTPFSRAAARQPSRAISQGSAPPRAGACRRQRQGGLPHEQTHAAASHNAIRERPRATCDWCTAVHAADGRRTAACPSPGRGRGRF